MVLFYTGFNSGLNLDFETEYIVGHSSGSHVLVNYLIEGCHKIKGLVLMSPVDGSDPFGINDDNCITPGIPLNFETPALVMPAGLDNIPGMCNSKPHHLRCKPLIKAILFSTRQ